MIVPGGHSQTPLHTSGQTETMPDLLAPDMLAHVAAHEGSEPHSLKICPLTEQFPINNKHNHNLLSYVLQVLLYLVPSVFLKLMNFVI